MTQSVENRMDHLDLLMQQLISQNMLLGQRIEATNQRIEASNRATDQRIEASNQRIEASNREMDQRIEASNRATDQRIEAINQRIEASTMAANQRMDTMMSLFIQRTDSILNEIHHQNLEILKMRQEWQEFKNEVFPMLEKLPEVVRTQIGFRREEGTFSRSDPQTAKE
jgi:hypothetical protein